jgi:hypothetical protein
MSLYLILTFLLIFMVDSTIGTALPVLAIFTFGIYRDGTGNKIFDKPADHWTVIDGSQLDMKVSQFESFVQRMASIPLSTTVNRSQLKFIGVRESKNTIVFQIYESQRNAPKAFSQIPDAVKKNLGENVGVKLKYLDHSVEL